MRRAPDGFVVVCRSHLALKVCVVRQADVRDLEAELGAALGAKNAVAWKARNGTVITWKRRERNRLSYAHILSNQKEKMSFHVSRNFLSSPFKGEDIFRSDLYSSMRAPPTKCLFVLFPAAVWGQGCHERLYSYGLSFVTQITQTNKTKIGAS
jgi:hypothetical protein